MPDRDWITVRAVMRSECPWLPRDLEAGERLRPYHGCTYGAVTPSGIAVSFDGETPFFEVPSEAVTAD